MVLTVFWVRIRIWVEIVSESRFTVVSAVELTGLGDPIDMESERKEIIKIFGLRYRMNGNAVKWD